MDESVSARELPGGAESDQRIGSYRVLEPLGAGGMSEVFRAVHEETGHKVVLKVLTRALARNSSLLQRFIREARCAETLEHQNIVTIYDRGIDRGRHYLVLEYVEGGDLHEYVQRRGALRVDEAISIVKAVASGLRYAAGRGLIHRDIKPSNILRTPAGVVKIIDLGLALQSQFEDERVTREGTTVGTVDYMSPEQARDSRATTIKSDIYSLGCTFYYFLTGVPPFAGGDVVEKLARHARSPAADVRNLRSEVPAAVSAIIQRMLAKRPDDRFASYDDLIAALESVSTENNTNGPETSLIPLADDSANDFPALSLDSAPEYEGGDHAVDEATSESTSLFSLAELAREYSDETRERPAPRVAQAARPAPLPRRGLESSAQQNEVASDAEEVVEIAPITRASSAFLWIIAGVLVGVALLLLTIGLLQLRGETPPSRRAVLARTGTNRVVIEPASTSAAPAKKRVAVENKTRQSDRQPAALVTDRKGGIRETKTEWAEPIDSDPPRPGPAPLDPTISHSKYLPEWARSALPERVSGPFVVVRRIPESSEVSTVPTLYMALDQRIGGTVEIADEGPLFNDNFRVAGDSRLIRARPGFRPIVRVERSSLEAVRKQPAVFVLDRQDVILDGIDLVVDVRDLGPKQTALFGCAASRLTLRNCSITIINPHQTPFSVVRLDPSGSHPNRVRLEGSFIRGGFTAGVDLTDSSPAEVSVSQCLIVGGTGPLVRIKSASTTAPARFFLIDSILAGPGPAVEISGKAPGGPTNPLSIQAFGTIFGRLHGTGVASVISSSSSMESAAKQIDWKGNDNLFAGWKGFVALGKEQIVTVPDLAKVRSTWNGADAESQEFPLPWPLSDHLAEVTREELEPFVPGREHLLRQAARPRVGLFQKAIGDYPSPAIPQPAGWTFEPRIVSGARRLLQHVPKAVVSKLDGRRGSTVAGALAPGVSNTDSAALELRFDTATPTWGGDLGAFLRERLTPAVRHARIRVIGSGQHRFTAVRLPRNLWLEVRVEPLAAAEPPSWSPAPHSTGPALIELRGGALVVSKLVLRHEPTSRLEHLIDVEDGHLVLSQCQFTAPALTSDFAGNLISFRSPTTQPDLVDCAGPVFAFRVSRPVCLLQESVLITAGTALKADLGRGLVALTQSAVAAGVTGIELRPSRVSRQRFEADLIMDHCTLASERAIVRMGPWPGKAPGPDRPWLITSRNCAFLAMHDRKARETVLLRSDADALARGAVSWHASDDAADVDVFTAAGEALPSPNRSRDLEHQWIHFWGDHHMRGHITGPKGAGSPPSVRFLPRFRPGRIEPVDLALDPDYHPGRTTLVVGADLEWLK